MPRKDATVEGKSWGPALTLMRACRTLSRNEAKPGQSVMKFQIAILSLMALASCGGNPLNNGGPTGGGGTGGGGGGTGGSDATVVVPAGLKNNIQSVTFVPGATPADSRIRIAIDGLDTTPVEATWTRRPALDVPGYTAFAVQEDPLDRLFVGLAAQSDDGSVRGVLAGDGGQFNRVFAGTTYDRTGTFDAPDASGPGPGNGQVSYAGTYVGLLNGGGSGTALLPVPPGTDPATRPTEPARVTGDAFVNANFADDQVNGAIFNRVIVGTGAFGLGSVILLPTAITANGTFEGETELDNVINSPTGQYGGVFGGTDSAGLAGAISLDQVHDSAGGLLDDILERGIFVLNQCGLAGGTNAPGCAGTAP